MRTLSLLLISLLCVGCGGGTGGEATYPVSGTVKFSDGTPLTKGIVRFESTKFSARGTLNEQGEYTLGSYETDDGAPEGEYKVFIEDAVEGDAYSDPHAQGATNAPPPKHLIAEKFRSAQSTDLVKMVKPESNTIDITVEKP